MTNGTGSDAARSKDDRVGQRDDVIGGHQRVLLRRPLGALVGGLPHPDPQSEQGRFDALTDGVHHTGAVLAGHLRRIDR